MKTIIMLIALGILAACNTFEGMGKDMQNAGEGISDTASKAKEQMNNR